MKNIYIKLVAVIALLIAIYLLSLLGYDKPKVEDLITTKSEIENKIETINKNESKNTQSKDGISKLETKNILDENNKPLKASGLNIENIDKDLINIIERDRGRVMYKNNDYIYFEYSVGPCCARFYGFLDKKTKQYYSIDLDINDEYESEKMGLLPYIFEANTDYGRGYKITNLDSQNVYETTLPKDKTIIKSYRDALNLGDFSYRYDLKFSTSTKILNLGIYKYDDIEGRYKVKSENYMKNQNVHNYVDNLNEEYKNLKISTTTIDLNNYK